MTANASLELLLSVLAQTVIRFRRQILFMWKCINKTPTFFLDSKQYNMQLPIELFSEMMVGKQHI